jgi:hypothetical protein
MKAIKMASRVRTDLGYNMFEPINIFETCEKLGLTVRFVDVDMEGMYVENEGGENSVILISNKRPLPRRVFTCAHELGHNRFGHGTKIDFLQKDGSDQVYNEEELLVDSFAGALLMPMAAIQAEFTKRGINPNKASAFEFYSISCVFGVGYSTLITHCKINRIISSNVGTKLLKHTPTKIFDRTFGAGLPKGHFTIIDRFNSSKAIDIEVNSMIHVPSDVTIEGDHLVKLKDIEEGAIFKADSPGLDRMLSSADIGSKFIRIQKQGYIGLSEYRHLEN